jgi:two-component system invasion response regulator UvrY
VIRILIADDHAIVRKGLKQLLVEKYPASEIDEVDNGESLIAKVINEQWDIVICDMDMPGRSGLDVMKQIKLIAPNLPVLIVSIHPEEQYAVRVLRTGAAGYVSKGAATEELAKAVQLVLQGRKYISSSIAQVIAEDMSGHYSSNRPLHELLSNREFEVFKLIASGKLIAAIAEKLSLSSATVSTHRARILAKMNMKTNAELTRYALDNKLI